MADQCIIIQVKTKTKFLTNQIVKIRILKKYISLVKFNKQFFYCWFSFSKTFQVAILEKNTNINQIFIAKIQIESFDSNLERYRAWSEARCGTFTFEQYTKKIKTLKVLGNQGQKLLRLGPKLCTILLAFKISQVSTRQISHRFFNKVK